MTIAELICFPRRISLLEPDGVLLAGNGNIVLRPQFPLVVLSN